jgi:YVTN family beta-propeller protein
LQQPVQDAAAVSLGRDRTLLAGGLDSRDVSTDRVGIVAAGRETDRGRLPGAVHDAAAVSLGRSAYVFGGGNGVAQSDRILRIDPATGRTTIAGRLPAASSDLGAAVVGNTAYVVGGFTGRRWLDTIVAWRPGAAPRVVAHLPVPLRYAAVTAIGSRLVIAGGSTPAGKATDEVLVFDPADRRLRALGDLPGPTTHAAAASLGGLAYVIGGRGSALDRPLRRVVAVDPVRGHIAPAGTLDLALSDLAAAPLRGRILLAGGRGREGVQAQLSELVPVTAHRRSRSAGSPVALPAISPTNVYAADRAGLLSSVARHARPLVYVPNSESNTVDVIDPRTYRVVEHFRVGALPQHVTPSYDLRTLYVTNDLGNSLTPLDPNNGRPGAPIPVADPYNLYFTPNGRYAIVVAERNQRLDFRDAHTMRLRHSLPVPCSGIDHLDFSADGSYLIASCEFSGQLIKVDVRSQRVVGTLSLRNGSASPQDVKLSPDGKIFYVADKLAGGVWEVDGVSLRAVGFLRTGAGAHGLYPSRDTRDLYVTNRSEGSISVVDFARRRIVAKWSIPGGSPDMGGVSADGKTLWVSGRYNSEVYAISTRTGRLLARIRVGSGPHGLCVWPQPGRYSLGHTGDLR